MSAPPGTPALSITNGSPTTSQPQHTAKSSRALDFQVHHSLHVTVVATMGRVSWVVLVHRVPREPSTPRIAIWRKLRALGAAQLGDGVVALPEDARTREHLEW